MWSDDWTIGSWCLWWWTRLWTGRRGSSTLCAWRLKTAGLSLILVCEMTSIYVAYIFHRHYFYRISDEILDQETNNCLLKCNLEEEVDYLKDISKKREVKNKLFCYVQCYDVHNSNHCICVISPCDRHPDGPCERDRQEWQRPAVHTPTVHLQGRGNPRPGHGGPQAYRHRQRHRQECWYQVHPGFLNNDSTKAKQYNFFHMH